MHREAAVGVDVLFGEEPALVDVHLPHLVRSAGLTPITMVSRLPVQVADVAGPRG